MPHEENGKAKVESFKLTKDQIAWSNAFQNIQRIEAALKGKMSYNYGELESAQRMFQEVSGKKTELLNVAPLDKLKELPGQEGD